MGSKIKKKIGKLPSQPGVYLMKDQRERVIYIGKARNLKQRVSYYYSRCNRGEPKILSLIRRVKGIDYLATDSEIDALFLEARLVRDIKPKYNIQLKDDKSFPLLAVSRTCLRQGRRRSKACPPHRFDRRALATERFGRQADDFPRVFITRQRGKKDITYYGPFTKAGDLRSALKSLQRIFRFRTCTRIIKEGKVSKPCLLYHINQCVAPCLGKTSKEDYGDIIQLLVDFLKGEKETVLKQLTKKMESASRQQDFEQAATCRDQINALKGVTSEGKMGEFYEGALASINPNERLKDLQVLLGLKNPPRKIEGIDISDIRGKEAVGSLVTFIDAEPFKNGYRRYKIKTATEGEPDDYKRTREVVRRRLYDKDNTLPDILLIDGGKGHLSVVAKVFSEENITPPLIVALSKRGGDHFITSPKSQIPNSKSLVRHSAGFTLLQYIRDEAHRFAQKYHHHLRRKVFQEQ